jgi:hypothetical protein
MAEILVNSLNNPTSTLTSGVTSGATTLPVSAPVAPDGWSTAGQFRVLIDSELIIVTAASSNATSLAVVTRGVEGTSAAAHNSGASVNLVATTTALTTAIVGAVSPLYAITSGALPTVTLTSGVGVQILTTRDAETVTSVTFNSTVSLGATCTVALSPDNVTYSTLAIETEPVGVGLAGTIKGIHARVPAGWYLRLSVAQAVIGTTTYF